MSRSTSNRHAGAALVFGLLMAALVLSSCATPATSDAESVPHESPDDLAILPPPDPDGAETEQTARDDATGEVPISIDAVSDDATEVVVETPPAIPGAPRLEPFPGVAVDVRSGTVELDAVVCLDQGWLEQVACGPGTREHEALVVPTATASQVHAALLAGGHRPGAPGHWEVVDDRVRLVPPSGSRLRVLVRYAPDGGSGPLVEKPIGYWIRDHFGRVPFPDEPWVFGGSHLEPMPQWMRDVAERDGAQAASEHYVADSTGSIIGLVTFGDEVIGYSRVLSDAAEVQAPEWEADPERMPPLGTPVVIVIRPWE